MTAGTVSINNVVVIEGDTGTTQEVFTVTRTGGTDAFNVDYATADGTAMVSDGDYVATSGALHFSDDVTSQTVSVTVNGDTRTEANEVYYLNLTSPTRGATLGVSQGQGIIINDDTALTGSIAINDVTLTEGDSGTKLATFTVTRTGGTAAFSVDYATADRSATVADGDYDKTSGVLNFATGVNTQTISVVVNGDTRIEGDEGFNVFLTGATNDATITDGKGAGIILNDDAVGRVSINDVTLTEGDSGTQLATFTVTRTGGSEPFSIDYGTGDRTATVADGDYGATSGTLTFAAGVDTQTISVPVYGDQKYERDEGFNVFLSNATNGANVTDGKGAGIIRNDDTTGQISINDVTLTEGDSGTQLATFTVTRSGGTTPFTVDYATANRSATAGEDYGATSGTLVFGAGVNVQTLSVPVYGDMKFESDEGFNVLLTNATNDVKIQDGLAAGIIIDDDSFSAVSINNVTVTEGDAGQKLATFTVTRTGGSTPFTIDYATADQSATVADGDYAATSGTLSFGAGVNTQTISVPVLDDTKIENTEAFHIFLSNATNNVYIAQSKGTGIILDNDRFPHLTDFNGDGNSDLLLYNQSTSDLSIWQLNGTSVVSTGAITPASAIYRPAAIGDVNGDGKSDIIFQSTTDDSVMVREMDGFQSISDTVLAAKPVGWHVAATGYFNGDGKADILLQNGSTGAIADWQMDGTEIAKKLLVSTNPGNLTVKGVGDFNGDGRDDILLEGANTDFTIWYMNGGTIQSSENIGPADTGYQFRGIGDFDGDGNADVLFQAASGAVGIETVHDGMFYGIEPLGNPGSSWVAQNTLDANGDGKVDILFTNDGGQANKANAGQPMVWLMNGTSILSSATLGAWPGSPWHVVTG